MEIVVGGVAAAGAGVFTNPLDVIKTRIQLQGELQNRGSYKVFYRNTLHAAYMIGKHDGLRSLQAGMGPALWYQFIMNGTKLGMYTVIDKYQLTRSADGSISFPKSIFWGGVVGAVGSFIASPFFLVKTQIQSQSISSIAVGYQHRHSSMSEAMATIYRQGGITKLWRGANAAMIRAAAGSSLQISTYSTIRAKILQNETMARYPNVSTFTASFLAGFCLCAGVTPLDIVRTRLCNQGLDPTTGRGLYYSGFIDCFLKIARTEGFRGLYKGIGASYLRIGPHTVLLMTFWTKLEEYFSILASNYDFLSRARLSRKLNNEN